MSEIKSGDYVIANKSRITHLGILLHEKGELLRVKVSERHLLFVVNKEGTSFKAYPQDVDPVPFISGEADTDMAYLSTVTESFDRQVQELIKAHAKLVPERLKAEFSDRIAETHLWVADPGYATEQQGVPDLERLGAYRDYVGMELERMSDEPK